MIQFDKVAGIYAQSRPTYPEKVYRHIHDWCDASVIHTAVDIACGAGHSIDGLIPFCKAIIGVEPGENLRNKARKRYPNLSIIAGTGEDTTLPAGVANLVTIATAFYWMDGPEALKEINRILKPGGALILYRYLFPVIDGEANGILTTHCEKYWEQFRDKRLTRNDDLDILIAESGYFLKVERNIVPNTWVLSVPNFVAFLSSTSYVSKYLETLTVALKKHYLESLTNEFMVYSQERMMEVNFDIHMILTKK